MTDYVILMKNDDQLWEAIDTVGARSSQAAIRGVKGIEGGGTFVAVPARSWKPVTVTTETKTTLKFQ